MKLRHSKTFYHLPKAGHSYLLIAYPTLAGNNLYCYSLISVAHEDEDRELLDSAKAILFSAINKELDGTAIEQEATFYFGLPVIDCEIHTVASIPPNCIWVKWPRNK